MTTEDVMDSVWVKDRIVWIGVGQEAVRNAPLEHGMLRMDSAFFPTCRCLV